MAVGKDAFCRKTKVWIENRDGIVHNADVTDFAIKLHNSTPYVNNCNYSTLDIVGRRRETTDILYMS